MDKKVLIVALAAAMVIAVGALYFAGVLNLGPASTIKSKQDATQTVGDISTGVQDINNILTNIDKKLG